MTSREIQRMTQELVNENSQSILHVIKFHE